MKRFLILFPSTHDALVAEKAWPRTGFNGKLRPIPRALSSSCGLCLESDIPEGKDPLTILETLCLQWEQIVEVQGKNLAVVAERQ